MNFNNVWLTSDPHYFHIRALEIMPARKQMLNVSSVEEMNEALIKHHNAFTDPNDLVIFLGDVVMGKKAENVPLIIPRLHGKKVLVMGNHDAGFEDRRPGKLEAAMELYLNNGFNRVCHGMVSLQEILTLNKIDGDLPCEINVCHFPYQGTPDHEGYDVRYSHLMPESSDVMLFHGHTHSGNRKTAANMIHVGVDAWEGNPVNLEDLLSLL